MGEHRHNPRVVRKALRSILIAFALSCMLITGSTVADPSKNAVILVENDETFVHANWTESNYLANRLLMRESSEPVFDTAEFESLSFEVEVALNAARAAYPEMFKITVRPDFRPNVLLLRMKPELDNRLAQAVANKSGNLVTLDSGLKQFAELNEMLGLFAVTHYPFVGMFEFFFEKNINAPEAATRYSKLKGIDFAEIDSFLPETSDIEVFRSEGSWYFLFSPSFADWAYSVDPDETVFFRVSDGQVHRYVSDCAGAPEKIPCPIETQKH